MNGAYLRGRAAEYYPGRLLERKRHTENHGSYASFAQSRSLLWFERLSTRLRLPFWVGAIIIGYLPFVVGLSFVFAFTSSPINGPPPIFVLIFLFSFLIEILFLLGGARYVCRKMERLKQYVESMSSGKLSVDLSSLYSLRSLLIVWGVATAAITFAGGVPKSPKEFLSILPWFYFYLPQATLIWVYAYSMYSVYRMGKLPLGLKPFSEDKTLGLRPFGTTSLQLTGIYLTYAMALVTPYVLENPSVANMSLLVGILLLSLVFFPLPLISLRSKLTQAKREKLSWIGPKYTQAIQRVEASDGPLSAGLSNELSAIKEIQRDIEQIHHWPFDVTAFARLSVVVLSIIAIILARILQLALHLAT